MTALTPANQVTLLRMLLIPGFVILVIYGHLGLALIVFLIAGLTDALDGLLARRSGERSTIGAWLDLVRSLALKKGKDETVSRIDSLRLNSGSLKEA